jgi:hypothetical protein
MASVIVNGSMRASHSAHHGRMERGWMRSGVDVTVAPTASAVSSGLIGAPQERAAKPNSAVLNWIADGNESREGRREKPRRLISLSETLVWRNSTV